MPLRLSTPRGGTRECVGLPRVPRRQARLRGKKTGMRNWIIGLLALVVGVFVGTHYAQGDLERRFEVRVWERGGEVALSIRPEGGRWSDHGTQAVVMDGRARAAGATGTPPSW